MSQPIKTIALLTILRNTHIGCSGGNGLDLQFNVTGSDGIEARSGKPAEIDPAINNGEFTISYAFNQIKNEDAGTELANGDDRVMLI